MKENLTFLWSHSESTFPKLFLYFCEKLSIFIYFRLTSRFAAANSRNWIKTDAFVIVASS